MLRQETVAGWVGITQTQLSRVENGPAIKDLDKLIQWARTLSIPAHLLWFKLPEQRHTRHPAVPNPHMAAFLAPVSLPSAGPFHLVRVGGHAGQVNGLDMAAMHTFRSADRQVGGGHLYATVVGYLHSDIAPRMFGADQGVEGKAVFTAAAALTEMAGWMAHDAGRDDQALERSYDEEPSAWVSHFDEGSLASEAARCLRQLGELPQAQRHAERIIELRPAERTRSRALGQLILVTVLIEQGQPEQACTVAQDVLDATQSLGSYQVIQQLRDLHQLLAPHSTNTVVRDFLDCLGEALRQRAWLYQWLTKDTRGFPADAAEVT